MTARSMRCRFKFMPNRDHEVAAPPITGRRVAMASLFGAAGYAVTRSSGAYRIKISVRK